MTELVPAARGARAELLRPPGPRPAPGALPERRGADEGGDRRARPVALTVAATLAVAAAVPLTIGLIATGSAPEREVLPPPAPPSAVTDPAVGILTPTSVGAGPTAPAIRSAGPGPGGVTPSGRLTVAPPTSVPRTSGPPSLGVNISIEAESPTTVHEGGVSVRDLAGASGGAVVTGIGDDAANLVRFTGLTVPEASTYTVTFFYASDDRRRARVAVNDGVPTMVQFPGNGDWDTVGSVSVRLPLAAGPNTIEFGNRNSGAPDLDRIVVVR